MDINDASIEEQDAWLREREEAARGKQRPGGCECGMWSKGKSGSQYTIVCAECAKAERDPWLERTCAIERLRATEGERDHHRETLRQCKTLLESMSEPSSCYAVWREREPWMFGKAP